ISKRDWSSDVCSSDLPTNRLRAKRPILAAPAVWEDEGPTITGPMISNTLLYFINFPPRLMKIKPHRRISMWLYMPILRIADNYTQAAHHRVFQILLHHTLFLQRLQYAPLPRGCPHHR